MLDAFRSRGVLPLSFALSALSLVVGCGGPVEGLDDDSPAQQVCGGSVCFAPTDVSVEHWGDGEVTLLAFRAEDLACTPPSLGDAPIAGTSIEITLHRPQPGARLPLMSQEDAKQADGTQGFATAHAVRVSTSDGRARAAADEETVEGTATILDIDEPTGRVRVRLEAKWSSGVTGDLLLDVEGPHACTPGSPQSIAGVGAK